MTQENDSTKNDLTKNDLKVTIAHDYLCPWCWVGFFQAKKLAQQFPQIRQVWQGYELLPEELGPLPDYKPQPKDPTAPTRFDLFAEAEGCPVPEGRTLGIVRTHSALEGAAYVQDKHPERFDAYNEAVYRAFWERSEDISDWKVLGRVAESAGVDKAHFFAALTSRAYDAHVIGFNDDAYAADITHVPTFVFRGERCAEAPYATIRELALRYLIKSSQETVDFRQQRNDFLSAEGPLFLLLSGTLRLVVKALSRRRANGFTATAFTSEHIRLHK